MARLVLLCVLGLLVSAHAAPGQDADGNDSQKRISAGARDVKGGIDSHNLNNENNSSDNEKRNSESEDSNAVKNVDHDKQGEKDDADRAYEGDKGRYRRDESRGKGPGGQGGIGSSGKGQGSSGKGLNLGAGKGRHRRSEVKGDSGDRDSGHSNGGDRDGGGSDDQSAAPPIRLRI